MKDAEILIVGAPDRSTEAADTAGLLQMRLLKLGAAVRRVTRLDDDVQVVADEIVAALRRRPSLLALVGGTEGTAGAGVAAATERQVVDDLPEGASLLQADEQCFVMLEAGTQVLALPDQPGSFQGLWRSEIGDSVAEWLGQPAHTRGELIVLNAEPDVLADVLGTVSLGHPAVYMRAAKLQSPDSGILVTALACGRGDSPRKAVDYALSEVERAASAARMQVSSSGRIAAHDVGKLD